MSTATTPYQVVLDPKAYAGIHLVESDGVPMETILHRDCMYLLIEVAAHHNRARPDYFVGGNNFIYFNPDQARNLDYRGPDFFYIKDGVDRARERQFWAVWEEGGRLPDVIIELTSPTTEDEDRTTKFVIYEQTLRTPEYFLYDPFARVLEGFRLIGDAYRPLPPNERGWLWSEELELWLGRWEGEYRQTPGTYLRLYTREGKLAPTPEEAALQQVERARQTAKRARQTAEQEKQKAERERQTAEREKQKADREQRRAGKERRRAEEAEREVARLKALLEQQAPKPDAPEGENP